MASTSNRVVDVFVRDRMGRAIPGAKIGFTLDGKFVGDVPISEGRGRIELQDRTKILTVSAAYGAHSQQQTLSQEQDAFTFSFDADVASESIMEKHIALFVGLLLITVSIVLTFVFSHPTKLQLDVIRGTFSLAGGAIATEISGILIVDMKLGTKLAITATGALAIFVILFFFKPA